MSNKKLNISAEGKNILDEFCEILEIERPDTIKLALAKGIAITNGPTEITDFPSSKKWTVPEGIIKSNDYLLFKHLIFNEQKKTFTEEELSKQMVYFLEIGLRELQKIKKAKNSLEDIRLSIL